MPTDTRSPNRNYPVPNAANLISEDFPRLITALLAIDTDVHGLLSSVAARALLVHTHAIADVTGLQAALDGKMPASATFTLASLTDVNVTGVSTGQFLVRGATQWQPVTVGPATVGAFPAASVSVFGASLIDDTDAPAARTTLGLGSSALMSDDRIAYGDANATISASARVVAVNVALTAARTLTLPACNAAGAPPYIIIVDEARGVSAVNSLSIQRAGSDTVNGGTAPIVLNTAGAAVILTRNGTTNWTAISTGGGGGQMIPYRYVATASQTSFSGADANGLTLNYVPGGLIVTVNGVTQTPNTFTASNGTSVVFSAGLTAGDTVVIFALSSFSVADTWTKAEANALFATPAQVAAAVASSNYRNRIVNPAMQISQEQGDGYSFIQSVFGSSVYLTDQWIAFIANSGGGVLTHTHPLSVTPGGASRRIRATVSTVDSSIVAGDAYLIRQFIEGQMIADARFGTASARQIVVRFGVRSSLAGTFGVYLTNSAGTRTYVTTITIAGGEINTDLLRTIVIPGDTSGTWLTDTGVGFQIGITLAAGTTFQTTAGSWQAGNFLTTSAQTNFMGTASATFELFDVGLYVDHLNVGAAPSWELPAFDADLRACYRYYYVSPSAVYGYPSPNSGGFCNFDRYDFPETMRTNAVVSTSYSSISNISSIIAQTRTRDFFVDQIVASIETNTNWTLVYTASARF